MGKTSLILSFNTNAFPDPATVPADTGQAWTANMFVDGENVALALWDTLASASYDTLRPLSYPQTDVFMLCFAVDSAASLDSVRARWLPELARHAPSVPIVLVGTRADLRVAPGEGGKAGGGAGGEGKAGEVTAKEAGRVAREAGAGYFECSARTHAGLREACDAVVRAAVRAEQQAERRRRRRRCTIL